MPGLRSARLGAATRKFGGGGYPTAIRPAHYRIWKMLPVDVGFDEDLGNYLWPAPFRHTNIRWESTTPVWNAPCWRAARRLTMANWEPAITWHPPGGVRDGQIAEPLLVTETLASPHPRGESAEAGIFIAIWGRTWWVGAAFKLSAEVRKSNYAMPKREPDCSLTTDNLGSAAPLILYAEWQGTAIWGQRFTYHVSAMWSKRFARVISTLTRLRPRGSRRPGEDPDFVTLQ